jgi:hypothetical protein
MKKVYCFDDYEYAAQFQAMEERQVEQLRNQIDNDNDVNDFCLELEAEEEVPS